jgi:hypothetical protein
MGAMGQSGVDLFEYGIQTENSDIRCHVSPGTQLIFIFRTQAALALDLNQYPLREATQPGVNYATSVGRLVPLDDIPDLRTCKWTSHPWWMAFSPDDPPNVKGEKAVRVAEHLLRMGRFPLWIPDATESTDPNIQRSGTDILLCGGWKIQVKCDYFAGPKKRGGTGNLFLQIAEINPLRLF